MSEGFNQWTGLGTVGQDPDLREFEGGKCCLKLRLACTTKTFYNNQPHEKTEWVSVTVWGARGRGLYSHVQKGDRLMVQGPLETRSYEKDGEKRFITEIKADKIVFAGGNNRSGSGKLSDKKKPVIEDPPSDFGDYDYSSDDIPF